MVCITYSYVLDGEEVKDQSLDTEKYSKYGWFIQAQENGFEDEYFKRQSIVYDILDSKSLALPGESCQRNRTITLIGHGLRAARALSQKVSSVTYLVGKQSQSFELKEFCDFLSKYEYVDLDNLKHPH